jgi:hypothetical protein
MSASKQLELLETIVLELHTLKTKMPNGEFKAMARDIEDLKTSYHDIKDNISDIKFTLLNPEDGVIVKVNKVSEWRQAKEKKSEEYENALQEVRDLMKWKEGASKALWIIFTAIVGLSFNVFFM